MTETNLREFVEDASATVVENWVQRGGKKLRAEDLKILRFRLLEFFDTVSGYKRPYHRTAPLTKREGHPDWQGGIAARAHIQRMRKKATQR